MVEPPLETSPPETEPPQPPPEPPGPVGGAGGGGEPIGDSGGDSGPVGGAGVGGALNCVVSAKSFRITACFHPANIPGYGTTAGFGVLASDILLILTGIAGSLSVILIIISGIKFVTSGGDPKKLESARQTLTYTIIGLSVTILVFVIQRVVQWFLWG